MRELETQSQSSKKKFTIIDILKVQNKDDIKQVGWRHEFDFTEKLSMF